MLRHDIDIPYSCKAGVCNTCVMVGEEKSSLANATAGLKDTLVEQGYFLSCQCVPAENIEVRKADDFGLFGKAIVLGKDILSQNVCRLRLRPSTDLCYRAGQYINLRAKNGQIRSYSLASQPALDDYLELHIKLMENGQVSHWLFNEAQVGDELEIQGPFGECFYLPGNSERDILMIGTGTGLAPLVGILRDAIYNGHQGQIKLYHGDRFTSDLYLDGYLRELASTNKNIQYFPYVTNLIEPSDIDVYRGRASEHALANNKVLKDSLVYLCGSPEMVNSARKQAYLNGAEMKHIYADPFVTKDLRLGKVRTNNKNSYSSELPQIA